MTPAEVLSKAADLIERRGLAHGTFQDGDGCLCADAAIVIAAAGVNNWAELIATRPGFPDWTTPRRLLHNHLTATDPNGGIAYGIAAWSDSHTGPQVVAALRATAYRAAWTAAPGRAA